MSSWYNSSVAHFASGVAVGAAAFVLVSKGMKIVSSVPQSDAASQAVFDAEMNYVLGGIPPDNGEQNGELSGLSTPSVVDTSPTNENRKLVDLMFEIAKDEAHRSGFIHRGITCNICSVSPVTGTRYKCANCLDYDVCEVCETTDNHDRTHVFLKIRYPIPPLANPKTTCLKPLYAGKNVNHASLTWSDITSLREQTYFDETEIQCLYEQFKTHTPLEDGITREAFDQCLGPLGQESNLVMDRMFAFYDHNSDGFISFDEFVTALSVLTRGSPKDKLKHVFEGYDGDRKGYLLPRDFHDMFKAYFHVSIELVRDYIKTCEDEMKASFDEAADKPVSSVFHAPIPSGRAGDRSTAGTKAIHGQPSSGSAVGSGGAKPLMEAMSQDAVDEMVANVFRCADLDGDGKISFDEFESWAILDNSILAWFDALGTVF